MDIAKSESLFRRLNGAIANEQEEFLIARNTFSKLTEEEVLELVQEYEQKRQIWVRISIKVNNVLTKRTELG
jgi:radical SAM superfamily enzyme